MVYDLKLGEFLGPKKGRNLAFQEQIRMQIYDYSHASMRLFACCSSGDNELIYMRDI